MVGAFLFKITSISGPLMVQRSYSIIYADVSDNLRNTMQGEPHKAQCCLSSQHRSKQDISVLCRVSQHFSVHLLPMSGTMLSCTQVASFLKDGGNLKIIQNTTFCGRISACSPTHNNQKWCY